MTLSGSESPPDPRSLALRFVGFTHSACHYYSQLFSTTQIGLARNLLVGDHRTPCLTYCIQYFKFDWAQVKGEVLTTNLIQTWLKLVFLSQYWVLGGTSICMHIVYVPRERPPFSALNFRSGAYHFHKLPTNPFRSITILHFFFADFAVPETIIFKISLISTRSSPPTAGSARTQRVRQRRELAAGQSASQARPGSSGDSHFHAQNGSSSFRSPAFSSSKRLKLVPEPRIFTLDRELVPEPGPIFHFAAAHTYQNLGWVPPPPPPRVYGTCFSIHSEAITLP